MGEHGQITTERGLELLAKVREICMKLPEVTEAIDAFGHTTFRVSDKPFVMMGQGEGDASLAIKTLPVTQEILLQQEGYFKTPYIGRHGWVSLRTEREFDWMEIADLITEGYLRTAPKRLAKIVQADLNAPKCEF